MRKKKEKKLRPWLIVVPLVLIAGLCTWQLLVRFEGKTPEIFFENLPSALGKQQNLSITVSDQGSGIRKIWVGILQKETEEVLLEKEFPRENFFSASQVGDERLEIPFEPKEIGLSDGEALLRVSVRDCSWRDWWRGNVGYVEKTVVVDTKPAQIEVLSDSHNISQGGSGLVIYRLSETCATSGVQVGDNFFNGMSGYYPDASVYICMIALGHEQKTDTEITVTATDMAGNQSRAGFYYHLQKKQFKKDTIGISDSFLQRKLPEFDEFLAGSENASSVDKFLKVNRELRMANYDSIISTTEQSDAVKYWDGVFERLPGSANRATFAEARDYYYNQKKIDHQTHLGIDLASVANAEVPAANAGKIVLADRLGIYGNTVIIDHGFGLFSLYSHLNSMSVQTGQIVSKGEIVGRTGATGMAGGDHLHFSMLVQDTFVNPIEWWDASWIENNISSKLAAAGVGLQ